MSRIRPVLGADGGRLVGWCWRAILGGGRSGVLAGVDSLMLKTERRLELKQKLKQEDGEWSDPTCLCLVFGRLVQTQAWRKGG